MLIFILFLLVSLGWGRWDAVLVTCIWMRIDSDRLKEAPEWGNGTWECSMPLCVRVPSSVSLLCLYKPRLIEEGLLTSKSCFPESLTAFALQGGVSALRVYFVGLFWVLTPFLLSPCYSSCLLPPASLPLINQPLALSSSRLGWGPLALWFFLWPLVADMGHLALPLSSVGTCYFIPFHHFQICLKSFPLIGGGELSSPFFLQCVQYIWIL